MRVGKYVWDIEMEEMSDEELEALADAAKYFQQKHKVDKYTAAFEKLLKEAEADGVQLLYIHNYSTFGTTVESGELRAAVTP